MIWQEKAINRIRQIFPAQSGVLVDHIRAAARLGRSDSICRRIAQAKNTEQILDYVAEGRFGLLFAHLRFATRFEPLGLKGPDLSISRDGQSAYVEVKRFRPGDRAEEIGDELTPYGNPAKDIKKILDRIIDKFKQLDCGNGVVALCSDHDDLEELEFEFAMKDIALTAGTGIRELPDTLLFCVYAPAWRRVGQRIYAEPFKKLSEPFLTWADDLRKL